MNSTPLLNITGPYELESMLARGGMAEVYLARSKDGRRLCIKQIRPELSGDAEFSDMFRREAGIACALNHPNIVRTFEFREDRGQLFIAMEYVDGLDLKTLLRRLTARGMVVSPAIALAITAGLLRALQAAHGLTIEGTLRPVIHRDVSPHNILLSLSGEVKLADFGIAKAKGSSSATRTGVIKGKLAYLSPEQANGDPVEPASDLYCAGLVLYEMLSGKRFHSGVNEGEILASVLAERSPRIGWLSEPINAFVARLLQRRPSARFADAGQALDAMDGLSVPISTEAECAPFFCAINRLDDLFRHGSVQDVDSPTVARSDEHAEDVPTRTSKDNIPRPAGLKSSSRFLRSGIAAAAVLSLTLAVLFFIWKRPDGNRAVVSREHPVAISQEAVGAGRDQAGGMLPKADQLIETGTSTTISEPVNERKSVSISPGSPGVSPSRKAAPKSEPAKVGFLEVNCRPWAEVFVGQRTFGTTPLRNIELPEGRHTVKLVNEALGVTKLIPVEIRGAESTRISVQLP